MTMRKFFTLPNSLTYEQKLLFLNDSLRITFVRHPFVRLVSCYQDKVVDDDYFSWREKIFENFKTSNSEVQCCNKDGTPKQNFYTNTVTLTITINFENTAMFFHKQVLTFK